MTTTHAREPDIANGRFIAVGGEKGGNRNACFRCHGLDGQGDSSGAFPRLAGQFAYYLDKQLHDFASETRPNPIMTPIARSLTEEQMQDVSAYYASLRDVPYPPPPPETDPRLLQRGGALAAIGSIDTGVQACAECHGPEGLGRPPDVPYLAGQFANYARLQLEEWMRGERANDRFGVMRNIAMRLSREDIEAVAAYYAAVRPGDKTAMDARALRPFGEAVVQDPESDRPLEEAARGASEVKPFNENTPYGEHAR